MNKDSAYGFICGLAVGTAIALLFAPQSGSKTQAQIARKTQKAKQHLKNHGSEVRESAIDVFEKGKKKVAQGLEHAVQTGRQVYEKSLG